MTSILVSHPHAAAVANATAVALDRHGKLGLYVTGIIAGQSTALGRLLHFLSPLGPVWRRYSHDGYGQRDDGSAYVEWGRGRAWPLLTGERGAYELCCGRDVRPYLAALERLARKEPANR